MALEQQRGGTGDVRCGHARSVEDGERAARARQRRREDLPAGRADVRLQQVSEGGQAGGGEARDDAAPAGGEVARATADPDGRAAATAGEERAQLLAVEVGDHAAADVELDRDRVRLAGAVVDDDDADAAGGLHTRALERERADTARDESDRAVQRAGGKRVGAAVEVPGRAAEVARHRLAVGADDRADVDELLVGRRPARGRRRAGGAHERDPRQRLRRPWRGHGEGGRVDVRVREGRDRDRVGCAARRAGGADAVVIAIVPGRDHRHDARRCHVPHRFDQRVAERVGLRAAAGEVDHVHAVANRRFEGGDDLRRVADVADRRRHVEDAVVADVGTGCDAGEPGRLRMVGAGGRRRVGVAGGDPGDVRAVERGPRVDGQRCALVCAGPDEGAGDDHLRRRPLRAALREAGGIAVALRVEEGVRLVDAVVDDSDLHPLAAAAAAGCERARADQARAAVEGERVAVARVQLAGEGELRRLRELRGRQLDGHPVQEQRVVALDRGARDRALQRSGGGPLRPLQLGDVRLRAAALHVQPARARAAGEGARVGGERRVGQRQDDGDAALAVRGRDRDLPGADARDLQLAVTSFDRLEGSGSSRRGDERHAEC